jgi:hypothetical protein
MELAGVGQSAQFNEFQLKLLSLCKDELFEIKESTRNFERRKKRTTARQEEVIADSAEEEDEEEENIVDVAVAGINNGKRAKITTWAKRQGLENEKTRASAIIGPEQYWVDDTPFEESAEGKEYNVWKVKMLAKIAISKAKLDAKAEAAEL